MSVTSDDLLDEMIVLLTEAVEAAGKKVRIGSSPKWNPDKAVIMTGDHGGELWICKGRKVAPKS